MMKSSFKTNVIAAGCAVALVGSIGVWGYFHFAARDKATVPPKEVVDRAPVNPSSNISKESPQGRAIATVEAFHQTFNTKVCYGNDADYKSKDSAKWGPLLELPELKSDSYRRLAESLANIQGAEIDLNRLAELADIAQRTHDAKALIYMHRILHDLDYWAFMEDGAVGSDFWGVTETAPPKDKDNRGALVSYIEKNKA